MIPEKHERNPIGRRVRKTLRGGVQETGLVREAYTFTVDQDNTWTYKVLWTSASSPNTQYEEVLALRTLQSFFTEEDTYVDEPWVADELRILQKVKPK